MPLLLFSIRMVIAKSGWSKRIGVAQLGGLVRRQPGRHDSVAHAGRAG